MQLRQTLAGVVPRAILAAAIAGAAAAPAAPAPAVSAPYFAIRVVDRATGRGVPLVQLRTTNDISAWTDSNGVIAFDEPGLMEREVYFHVSSPGYEYRADGFGYRGIKLRPAAGAAATIAMRRLNIAERLYRVTGQGIYRDSVLTGNAVPLKQPVLNAEIMGQDTVIATPYRGRIFWFWGDTGRAAYPLGHFGAAGATSERPGRGGLDPSIGVDLTYFVGADGFSRPMCPTPDFGMKWLEGVFTVRDRSGRQRLVSRLAVQKQLGDAHEWHLVVFDDEAGVFQSIQRWDLHDPHQSAHPFRANVNGREYWYLFPDYRVPAEFERLAERGNYEAFTCVAGDGRWRESDTDVERDAAGRVRFHWKPGADRLTEKRIGALVARGLLTPEECPFRLVDFESGIRLGRQPECVAWNEFLGRWIAFAADKPGEAWFATADTPVGPWAYARRVVTHGDYNFYNLAHHAFFNQSAGRVVYFEGTYTDTFSPARSRTPRYDYNQLMYRLDLADERLQLPVAVYAWRDTSGVLRLRTRAQLAAASAWKGVEEVSFFALPPECRREGTIPVYAIEQDDGTELSLQTPSPGAAPLFVALAVTPRSSAPSLVAAEWRSSALATLRTFRDNEKRQRRYTLAAVVPAGLDADGPGMCRVWRAPAQRACLDPDAQALPLVDMPDQAR